MGPARGHRQSLPDSDLRTRTRELVGRRDACRPTQAVACEPYLDDIGIQESSLSAPWRFLMPNGDRAPIGTTKAGPLLRDHREAHGSVCAWRSHSEAWPRYR